jgi:hypothetical protein
LSLAPAPARQQLYAQRDFALEMNKQKQQEIKGFLGWLEGYVGAKVEDLTPKTVARRATTSTIARG